MAFTQAQRHLKVETPLGPDAVLLTELVAEEAMSALFRFDLALLSERPDVDFDAIVGKSVSVSVVMDGGVRYFHGIVSQFAQSGSANDFATYRAEVVPWLWFLTRTGDCRTFQKMSVPDIAKKLFADYGFSDYSFRLQGSYEPREYCVQYRETAYQFIARLMEEEGIFFFFEHEADKHTLVFADSSGQHKPCPVQSRARLVLTTESIADEDVVTALRRAQSVQPGKYTATDYNPETPTLDLAASAGGQDTRQYEVYDYPAFPGETAKRADVERYVRVRQEEADAGRMRYTGSSYRRSFTPGYRFMLRCDPPTSPNRAFDGEYVLSAVRHRAAEGYGQDETGVAYENDFECIPATVPFRPARRTPKPMIMGVHTAVVVGPKGEEIFTDKYGRVKVKFHWDREGKADENNSCWIRVSQPWAGKGWGGITIPRIGQEVLVSFVEGDPDRPLVTGRVYNADHMPPYELPAHATKSTLKSYSSKGGGGFNEIRFEDKAGEEQLFIHAHKDYDARIGNDRREWIERDGHLVVKRDQVAEIGRSQHCVIKKDRVADVAADDHLNVAGMQAVKIAGSKSLKVDGGVNESFQTHSEQVAQTFYLNAGMSAVIEAGVQLTFKVGGNFIDISPAGVAINGTLVMINSGGAPGSGTAGSLVSPISALVAEIADHADPGHMGTTYKKQRAQMTAAEAAAKDAPAHDPSAEENQDKTHFIEVELVDEAGKPVAGERVQVTLPDGQTLSGGTTNEKGLVKITNIDPGSCKIGFPDLDDKAWE